MLIAQVVNGLSLGLCYSLMAIGYNLMFGVLRVVHLAYGAIFSVGAYAFIAALSAGVPLYAALGLSLAVAILTGLAIFVTAIRPLGDVSSTRSVRQLSVVVSTLGISILVENLILLFFSGYPQPFMSLTRQESMTISGFKIGNYVVLNSFVSLLSMTILALVLRRLRIGLRLRALTENRELAACIGIASARDEYTCVAISSLLAGLAALLIGEVSGAVSPFEGASYGLKALIVVFVGGLGNMIGAVIASLALGLLEALTVAYWSSNAREGIAYVILITFILLARLRGLREMHERT